MLDADLAELYRVETKAFNQAVKRNFARFPEDFMFQLTPVEAKSLRSQIVTSKRGRGGRRYRPFAFTQEGVAMLSSVLNSARAVQVNIAIMRAFVALREMAGTYANLARKSYKRECQETFFSARLRRRMLSCIQSPTPSNAHALRLIVLDLSQQQRDFGFRVPAVSCL